MMNKEFGSSFGDSYKINSKIIKELGYKFFITVDERVIHLSRGKNKITIDFIDADDKHLSLYKLRELLQSLDNKLFVFPKISLGSKTKNQGMMDEIRDFADKVGIDNALERIRYAIENPCHVDSVLKKIKDAIENPE